MSGECSSPIGGGFNVAGDVVPVEFAKFNNLVTKYTNEANEFSQMLADYEIIPIDIQPVTWDSNLTFVPFVRPFAPGGFVTPDTKFDRAPPTAPSISGISTSGLDAVIPPTGSAPGAPNIIYPPPPVLNLPPIPDNPPVVGDEIAE